MTKPGNKKSPGTPARELKHPDVNLQGQALGRKGQQTRQRLLEAVEQLLRTKRLRELRQAEVCRVAKVSPPAFYLYFPDIEALVLEAIAINQVIPDDLYDSIDQPWASDEVFTRARAFVARYVDYWSQHYHVLKARNLAADEGDLAVRELRFSVQVPILKKIAGKIALGQERSGDSSLLPLAGAAVVLASLERLVATMRSIVDDADPNVEFTTDDLIDAEAWILTRMIGGAPPMPPGAKGRKQKRASAGRAIQA